MLNASVGVLALAPQRGQPESITWSIKPVPDPQGAERASFTAEVEPGQMITDSVQIKVLSSNPIAFEVYASDAFITPTGGFDLLVGAEAPKDLGSWVQTSSSSVLINPGEPVEVPFTIRVPDNATPGDHAGGIVSSLTTLAAVEGGAPVRVERRLGTRIYLRVIGPVEPKLEISKHRSSFEGVWNPTGRGSVTTSYTVENTGNVRLKARQRILVGGLFQGQAVEFEDLPELLPGSRLDLSQQVKGVVPSGRLTTEIVLEPFASAEGEVIEPAPDLVASATSLFALPYALLLFLALAGGICVLLLVKRRRLHHRQRPTEPPPTTT
ncbi:MAG: WxL protein peptidoglycan domain-containing protein [Actinomycetota bacterium]